MHSSNGASIEIESTVKLPKKVKGTALHPTSGALRRYFSVPETSPFDQVEWERRDCTISNEQGAVVFVQKNVEVPKFWSQMAATVVASKYLHGAPGTAQREDGVRALITRVVKTITAWGAKSDYFAAEQERKIFADELSYVLLHQKASFNSPVWFNLGIQAQPQCSACFIISVEDTLDSLLALQTLESRIFKYGSGTGTNFSWVRSSKEALSGGGKPSGPLSFMRAFDAWAGIIKSGGKTRRAAKMLILNVDHPDISDFIDAKLNEEKKAWTLIEGGYDGAFASKGGAYESVGFQNANLSVRATDEFMRAADSDSSYNTRYVKDRAVCERISARKILRQIAEATHLCGDPGMQFDTTINAWHTVPNAGRINASNPCSEYMSLDNSACNLSSINLLSFLDAKGEFDLEGFEHTVDLMLLAQDILIDQSSYPSEAIASCARKFRQLGLGYTNLGALLMSLGVPYDSECARVWAATITAVMTGRAYCASAELAKRMNPFDGYAGNREEMLAVIKKHSEAAAKLEHNEVPRKLLDRARTVWQQALQLGQSYGYRNSQTTVLAPTGTISFMMDCDTTGIEPELALIKYKKLVGGGMLKLVNHSVPRALSRLGYAQDSIKAVLEHIEQHGSAEGAHSLRSEHIPVFDCALRSTTGSRCIGYKGHLAMMAAVQPFISGAISKTVNLPAETSVEKIEEIYIEAWRSGLKAVALYRDGSKRTQPLNVQPKREDEQSLLPVRRKLPDERPAVTHRFTVGGFEGYLTVGLYQDGKPGELFLVVAKEGSTLSGVMDAFATSVSMALQYGVPLEALVRKFSHMRFEPAGFTNNKELPIAKSIMDYVFRWLGLRFLSVQERTALGLFSAKEQESKLSTGSALSPSNSSISLSSEDSPPCSNCGSSLMVRQGSCYVCLNCGTQGGCG